MSGESSVGQLRRFLSGAVYVLCVMFGTSVLWLSLWVAAPAVGLGWAPVVLEGDSMTPLIGSGDVVLISPPGEDRYDEGTIITFEDPAIEGRVLTHRIRAVNEDGTYLTKGDGNRTADSTAVPTENVRGAARALVPVIGLPVVWWHHGQYQYLALLGVALMGAFAYASRYARSASADDGQAAESIGPVTARDHPAATESPRSTPARLGELRASVGGTIASQSGRTAGRPRQPHPLVTAGSLVVLVVGLLAAQASVRAAFADSTDGFGSFSAADSFGAPLEHVKTVGTSTCGGSSSTITVPASGVAAGNTVVVRFVIRNGNDGAVTATDSRGNTYGTDAHANEGSVSTTVLSAHIDTALQSGDVITVSHPDHDAEGVVIDEFSGIAATDRVDATAIATGTASPSVTVSTVTEETLLYGALSAFQSPSITEAAGWTSTSTIVADCKKPATGHGAYRVVAVSGDHTWSPTFGSSADWSGAIVAYKPASTGPDTTAPPAPTLSGTAGDGQNSLSWTAVSDPSTPVSYQLYRDGDATPIYDGTDTSHTDTGLTNGTSYSYVVRATDAADNQSGDSNTVTLTPDTDPYATAVSADGPVGWWRLGEASGTTAVDATANDNHGTYEGSPTLGEPGIVASADTAVSLHASTSDYIVVPDAAVLDGHTAMTWELWIDGSNLGAETARPLLCKRSDVNADQAYCLYVDGTNKVRLKMGDGSAGTASSTGTVSNGQPTHVVVTFDGAAQQVSFYLDGSLDTTESYAEPQVPAMASDLFVGLFNPGDSRTLDGRIDEVAIYDRALTATEIAEHHTVGAG